jgi:hypothetical protein
MTASDRLVLFIVSVCAGAFVALVLGIVGLGL